MTSEEAISLIKNRDCPACGPQKLIDAWRIMQFSGPGLRYVCMCCGRLFTIIENKSDSELQLNIESLPPGVDGEYPYRCATDFPGQHKWPINYNNLEAEPLTEEEKSQTDGTVIYESPYIIRFSPSLVEELMRQDSVVNMKVVDGVPKQARIVNIIWGSFNGSPSLFVEFDMPVNKKQITIKRLNIDASCIDEYCSKALELRDPRRHGYGRG